MALADGDVFRHLDMPRTTREIQQQLARAGIRATHPQVYACLRRLERDKQVTRLQHPSVSYSVLWLRAEMEV